MSVDFLGQLEELLGIPLEEQLKGRTVLARFRYGTSEEFAVTKVVKELKILHIKSKKTGVERTLPLERLLRELTSEKSHYEILDETLVGMLRGLIENEVC